MKIEHRAFFLRIRPTIVLPLAFVVLGLFLCGNRADAQLPPPGWGGPTNVALASWSFSDPVDWTSDQGDASISFTNIGYSYLGNFASLVVDTNVPAWLNYAVADADFTNLVLDSGSVAFWYGPQWATTNGGPGQWSQLVNVGELTTNASHGYWGLSVDAPGSNLWFMVQDGLGDTYGLSAPISWPTNYFHFIVLTYSSTNVAIYLDGLLATNDPGGLNLQPGATAISDGIYFGSDTNGLMQGAGYFDSLATYSYPLSSNDVLKNFNWNNRIYEINPYNTFMANIVSAPSTPSTPFSEYDIITGPGNLQQVGTVAAITSTNVWITNVVVSAVGGGTNNMHLQFTIQGGLDGVPYDTFANSMLDFSANTNKAWAWQGQGYHGTTYVITNLPNTTCFLILGTPRDDDFDGLTTAYERLVSKTDPNNADTDGDGISDSDEILSGSDPLTATTGWRLDTDNDGLPDSYENANQTIFGLQFNVPEAAPGLPAYTGVPVQ